MTTWLQFFILIPIIGFLVTLLIVGKNERAISWTAFVTVAMHVIGALTFTVVWLLNDQPILNDKHIVLLKAENYEFFIDYYFDRVAATYLVVGSFLTFLVTAYSRYYLHRETGYKRFFNTILFFFAGYNLAVLGGNMETLFIGWEILGISSFLLIAFYRDRYLPVKNAVKVFSVYRIGDVGLILAMWMSHHLWHENILFSKLNNYEIVHTQLQAHSLTGVFITMMILLSAAAKSAQLPFSSWLPRAMEGPTPSSAIFYGSLSVHLGVFLLSRTFPFWEHQLSARIMIGLIGLLTTIMASGATRVQSSIKSKVAYASMAQIGIMFIELAFGLVGLALIHFAGNAFLRTYQLLVSPSVVTYLIREQFYNFSPRRNIIEWSLSKRIKYSLYVLCLKEWNLDSMMYRYLWNPVKWAGKKLDFLSVGLVFAIFVPTYVAGLFGVYNKELIPIALQERLPLAFAIIALMMVLKGFAERNNVWLSWILVSMSHFWVVLAVAFNENFSFEHVHIYLSGVTPSAGLGLLCLYRLKTLEGNISLNQFRGYSYHHRTLAFIFLIACLGLAGFPITPTFIGEDLIFSHIHENQFALASCVALSFIVGGLALVRIYARVFMGPRVKSIYETAYRSS